MLNGLKEMSTHKIQKCRLELGFPSNSLKSMFQVAGASSCLGLQNALISVCLSVCLPAGAWGGCLCCVEGGLCGAVWLVGGWGGLPPGKGNGPWERVGDCQGVGRCSCMDVGNSSQTVLLVLFEIRIPFLLNFWFVACTTGQVILHHVLS